jgi:hypothetical protein
MGVSPFLIKRIREITFGELAPRSGTRFLTSLLLMTTFCNRLVYNPLRFLTSFGMTMAHCMDWGGKQERFAGIFLTLPNLSRNAPASLPP